MVDQTEQAKESSENAKTCHCGYVKSGFWVSAEMEYSFGASLLVYLVGITMVPKKILFRCRKCLEVIEETTDPDVCFSYRSGRIR